ncbi:MAG TPA: polyprenyl diphosphate synthase, partial [Vampirovibrionales bacterium]
MKQEYPTPLKHVAIIMDGNRRWAETKKLPSFAGHKRGLNTLKDIVKVCPSLDISYLTVYAFSTENWSRKEEEVKYLFTLFTQALKEEIDELKEQGVKLKFIGSKKGLNEKLKESMQFSEEITQNNSTLNLQVAFNYGSQTELVEAVQSIALEV